MESCMRQNCFFGNPASRNMMDSKDILTDLKQFERQSSPRATNVVVGRTPTADSNVSENSSIVSGNSLGFACANDDEAPASPHLRFSDACLPPPPPAGRTPGAAPRRPVLVIQTETTLSAEMAALEVLEVEGDDPTVHYPFLCCIESSSSHSTEDPFLNSLSPSLGVFRHRRSFGVRDGSPGQREAPPPDRTVGLSHRESTSHAIHMRSVAFESPTRSRSPSSKRSDIEETVLDDAPGTAADTPLGITNAQEEATVGLLSPATVDGTRPSFSFRRRKRRSGRSRTIAGLLLSPRLPRHPFSPKNRTELA